MTDYISTNALWTILLLVHLILAIGLLGALTHQAMAVALPVRQSAGGIVSRFRAVPAAGYATAVCVLWVLTFIVGSYIYTKYRVYIRIPLEAGHYYKTGGFFDFKEHVATLGLVLLPAYWFFWKNAQNSGYDNPRKGVRWRRTFPSRVHLNCCPYARARRAPIPASCETELRRADRPARARSDRRDEVGTEAGTTR